MRANYPVIGIRVGWPAVSEMRWRNEDHRWSVDVLTDFQDAIIVWRRGCHDHVQGSRYTEAPGRSHMP